MPSPHVSSLGTLERSHLAKTVLRAVVSASLLLSIYYLFPIEHRAHQSIVLRLTVALAIFATILATEIRLIANHDRPDAPSGSGDGHHHPLFLVMFAWIYLTMSASNPGRSEGT